MNKLTFPLQIKSFNNEDGDPENFRINGNAAVFDNIDSFNDIIQKGAFTNTLNKGMPPILWQHNRDEPIGVSTSLIETEEGLFVSADMPRDDNFVSGRVIPQIRIGAVKALSIGFHVVKSRRNEGNRLIDEIDLREISLVTMPANDQALISSFKKATEFEDLPLAPLDRTWDKDVAISRVRQFTDSVDEPRPDYKRAFFYYDPDNADDFGAYKFPFVDIIDGKMMAIANAINNASARIDSSTIPDADKTAVKRNIERYREKIEAEREDENNSDKGKNDSVCDFNRIQNMSHIELKNSLMAGFSFTKEAANFIASSSIINSIEEVESEKIISELKSIQSTMSKIITTTGN